ncbi:hypothetical protein [Gallionella capsiferriformans]|uniref:O-antigen polymerase n=1 Tax=Gallionella capsiferriformans (strain ES-2) TaxID=395494 RepID=D9SFL1_GALCS|nr:hypothetical protein [Gallionella capsiferriformans]ADL55308.1 hypothetical protein Galf_1281 [Gallionella capsiferriformans ES-2]
MIIAFLVSFFSFVHISAIGELYISELVLGFSLILLAKKRGKLFESTPKLILILGFLWLCSQILTDLVQASPVMNLMKGWAAIIFFLIDFAALYLIVGNSVKRAKMSVLGFALGGIFQFFVAPTEFGLFDPWKWALAGPVTLLVLLFLDAKNKSAGLVLLTLVILGMIDIYLNARSMGGMTILAGLIVYLCRQPRLNAIFKGRVGWGKKLFLTGISFVLISLLLLGYQSIMEAGFLPENVTKKYEQTRSSSLGLLGLIFGGRIEILASAQAVLDSPIIGHGSWAEDRKYSLLLLQVNDVFGTEREMAELEFGANQSDLIPAHSHLMQAWVWAGIMGALFWFYILKFIIGSLFHAIKYPSGLQTVVIFFSISAIWDVLFSPFGATMRLIWAIKLVVILVAKEASESVTHAGVAKP